MIPRQWLVSCHRRRASAEAHQSVSDPPGMPPCCHGGGHSGGGGVGGPRSSPAMVWNDSAGNGPACPRDYFQSLKCSKHRSALRLPPVARIPVHRRASLHGASGGGARSAPDQPSSWLAVEFPTTHPSCPYQVLAPHSPRSHPSPHRDPSVPRHHPPRSRWRGSYRPGAASAD